MARMAGADIVLFSSPYSAYPFLKRRYRQIADMHRLALGDLQTTMPAIGGGVHPNGPAEGAKAMMQAAEALGQGISLYEIAGKKGYEALKISLEKWE
jgi:ribulose 1,5-bisphosphate carboxylase large subunit-like protein